MSNPWFRLYAEFANDPKVQIMSEQDQRRLIMIFCMRCNGDSLPDKHVTFQLRITPEEWATSKCVFIDAGFIDSENNILNWDKRQFISDSSVERVQKYRANRKSMGLSSNGYTKYSAIVMNRDNNCCVYCGSNENLCIDHILPTALGGNDDIENLATSCKSCNSGKAGRTPSQAKYLFVNLEVEKNWLLWVTKNNVTVTVTPPEQNRTDTEHKQPKYIPPIPDDLLQEWILIRKKKKSGEVTERVFKGIEREAKKAGVSAERAVEICCEKGWASFDASWMPIVISKQDSIKRTGDLLTGRSREDGTITIDVD